MKNKVLFDTIAYTDGKYDLEWRKNKRNRMSIFRSNNTGIVPAFPGVGKTYAVSHFIGILDFDLGPLLHMANVKGQAVMSNCRELTTSVVAAGAIESLMMNIDRSKTKINTVFINDHSCIKHLNKNTINRIKFIIVPFIHHCLHDSRYLDRLSNRDHAFSKEIASHPEWVYDWILTALKYKKPVVLLDQGVTIKDCWNYISNMIESAPDIVLLKMNSDISWYIKRNQCNETQLYNALHIFRSQYSKMKTK